MNYRSLILSVKRKLTNKIYNNLLVVITNYTCTLRCKYCGNLNRYIKNKMFFDFIELSGHIERLAKYMFFGTVQLQGGEPLLHPHLDRIIANIYKSKISYNIEIATNATLYLSDNVIKACKLYNVGIRISGYGLKSQITSKIIDQCKTNNIRYYFNKMGSGNYSWYLLGLPGKKRNNDNNDVQKIYNTCPFNKCWTLSDGLLTRCSRSPIGHLTGLHEFFQQDFVKINNSVFLKNLLKKFYAKKSFMECCRFCNGKTGKEIPAGEQVEDTN